MSNDEMTVRRGEGEEGEELQAQLDAKMEGVFEQAATLELAGPQNFWNIWASGPYQASGLQPFRVIQSGELAWIYVMVYLNPTFPHNVPGGNACDIITGFNGKIELNFVTSNMQTMTPVPALSHTVCFKTRIRPNGQAVCWYSYLWKIRPTEAACLYETNICARICNCDDTPVRQYAGFVRWVEDIDVDYLFPPMGWGFDRPIRYMVSDLRECYNCPD